MNTSPSVEPPRETTVTPLTNFGQTGVEPTAPLGSPSAYFLPIENGTRVYQGQFTVSSTKSIGDLLYKIDTDSLFSGNFIPPGAHALYTATNRVSDFLVTLEPVKLGGSEVELELRRSGFKTQFNNSYSTIVTLDPDKTTVTTDTFMITDQTPLQFMLQLPHSQFVPYTRSDHFRAKGIAEIYMRGPYMRTNVHPNEFTILVFIEFINTKSYGNLTSQKSSDKQFPQLKQP